MSKDKQSNQAEKVVVAPVDKAPFSDQTGPLDAEVHFKDGAEAGVARFCEQTFINPESTRNGADALLNAFDNSGLWLANLVQPAHLLAELSQSSCTLTRVIVTQWTRQGETHKLSRLGLALLETQPPVRTHEGGQIMALLASLLGILRPPRAQRLLETSRPLLRDSTDLQLLNEANEWVAIGCILEELSSEDRVFWNRRLREPTEDWEWDTAEARGALLRLAPLMKVLADEDLPRFQRTVPGCWWDAIHEPKAADHLPNPLSLGAQNSRLKNVAIFVTGLLVGGLAMTVGIPMLGEPPEIAQNPANAASKTTTLLAAQAAKHPQAAERQAALVQLIQKHGDLQRLHNVVKTGSVRENEALIYGRGSMAPMGSPYYRTLIRWLMLDPPDNADVRLAIAKIATRALPPEELLSTLKMCIYPGSPNEGEASECANWTLELGAGGLTEAQKRELEDLPKTMAKS
jgi:hypothetical protein